ncbi:SLC17A6 (predicted) [Pycnogonum litorale]
MAVNEYSKLLVTKSVTSERNEKCTVSGIRYFMTFLCWLSLVCSYVMKVDISIAIVDMVSTPGSESRGNVFDWNSTTQGLILSSFYWGYIITQIPGGLLASRYGTKICLTVGTLADVFLSLLTPICTLKGGTSVLISIRFLEGLCLGITFPCYPVFLSKWCPISERSRLLTLTYSGFLCGPLFTFVLGGQIVQNFGWEFMFYTSGLIGAVWTILWLVFASDAPEDNRFISHSEREYIVENRGNVRLILPFKEIPWKHMLTSPPFLSIVLASYCDSWVSSTMLSELPTYIKRVFGFDTTESGAISGAPYVLQTFVLIISGYLSDIVIKRSIASTKFVRRLCVCFGTLFQATFLVLIANIENSTSTIAFLICGRGMGAFIVTGYQTNLLDIAPNIVGPMMGIANFFSSLASILAPIVSGLVVDDQTSFDQWKVVFYISAGMYVICCVVFGCFSSGEKLDWDTPRHDILEVETESGNEAHKIAKTQMFDGKLDTKR